MGAWRVLMVVMAVVATGCRPDPNAKCASIELGSDVSKFKTIEGDLLKFPSNSVMKKGPVLEVACCSNPMAARDCPQVAAQADCTQYQGATQVSIVDANVSLEPYYGNQDEVLTCAAAVKDGKFIAIHSFIEF